MGFVSDKGFYTTAYSFENDSSKGDTLASSETKTNYGVQAGYDHKTDRMDVNVAVGYLYDMAGVNAVETYIHDNNLNYYQTRVGAYSFDAAVKTGPFGLNFDYVTADRNYDATVIPAKITDSDGAQPYAGGVDATYDFMLKQLKSQILVGYQGSGDANAIGLPEKRYELGYNAFPVENLMVGLLATRDTAYDSDYTTNDGSLGTGDNYYTYSIRVGVKF